MPRYLPGANPEEQIGESLSRAASLSRSTSITVLNVGENVGSVPKAPIQEAVAFAAAASHSPKMDHVEAEEEKMDELSILLFNAGLDDYEESIRAKAITTPEELEKMDERDVRKLIAKPVHARKMLDLIKGRKLRSVSVKFSRPWAANARRAPTPDGALKKRIKSENVAAEATFPGGLTAMDSAKYATVRVDDGTPVSRLAAAWNQAVSQPATSEHSEDGAPSPSLYESALRALVQACDEVHEEGEKMTPGDILSFLDGCGAVLGDRSGRAVLERRLVLLAASRCFAINDAAAYKEVYWTDAGVDVPTLKSGSDCEGIGASTPLFRHLARGAQAMNNLKKMPGRMQVKRTLMDNKHLTIRSLMLPPNKRMSSFHRFMGRHTPSRSENAKSVRISSGAKGESSSSTAGSGESSNFFQSARFALKPSKGSSSVSSEKKHEKNAREAEGTHRASREAIANAFGVINTAWDATTRIEYKAYTCLLTVSQAADVVKAFNVESLLSKQCESTSQVLQDMIRTEHRKLVQHLEALSKAAEELWHETTAIQNRVQLDMTRKFSTLSGGPFRGFLDNDRALQAATLYRVVTPLGSKPGNVLRVTLELSDEAAKAYDVLVPENAVPGETILFLKDEVADVGAEEKSASTGTEETPARNEVSSRHETAKEAAIKTEKTPKKTRPPKAAAPPKSEGKELRKQKPKERKKGVSFGS